jgi:SAM-dependent methyltransferase
LEFANSYARSLDYGCGAGEVVRAGLHQGLDIYGCETFYDGGSESKDQIADLLESRIFAMANNRIPFSDESFDCVVSNMVFEHVEDINLALSEIRRVLKPGGAVLVMLPSKEVVREGHCGVPFAHRLSQYRIGYYWLLVFRLLGFGYHKGTKTAHDWAHDFQIWLNAYCFYRTRRQLLDEFHSHGFAVCNREDEVIRRRRLPLFTPYLFRKFSHMVLVGRKAIAPAPPTPTPSR